MRRSLVFRLALLASVALPLAAQPAVPEITPSATLRLAAGTLPEGFELARIYPDGLASPAGDVNGDGRSDLLIASSGAVADARTADLGDATGQTLVFFGPGTSAAPDQVVFDRLLPAGDTDGDGFADAYATSPTSGSVAPVRLYRGSAAGYVDAGVVTVGGAPLALGRRTLSRLGDFDGDGRPDVAVEVVTRSVFGLLLSRPGGTVDTLEVRPYTPAQQRWVNANVPAIGDVDGDGRDELRVVLVDRTDGSNHRLVVLRAEIVGGEVVVTTEVDLPTTRFSVEATFLADLDGDGDLDLAAVDFTSNTLVFVNDGGALDPEPYLGPRFAPAGDLDGDGIEDALVPVFGSAEAVVSFGPLVYHADRQASFSETAATPALRDDAGAFATSIVVPFAASYGDLDGDGRAEIPVKVTFAGERGYGAEAFGRAVVQVGADRVPTVEPVLYAAADFPAARVRYAAGLGDVDGDGLDDLGVVFEPTAFTYDPRIEVRAGGALDGPPLAALRLNSVSGAQIAPARVVGADVDGDGLGDIVAAFPNETARTQTGGLADPGAVAIWLGGAGLGGEPDWVYACPFTSPAPGCDAPDPFRRGAGPSTVAVSDLNADGVPDVAFLAGLSGSLVVLLGADDLPEAADPLPADRTVVRELGSSFQPSRLRAVGDLDADGFGDLAACDLIEPCQIIRGGPSGLAEVEPLVLALGADVYSSPGAHVASGDFSGDGLSDLLVSPFFGRGETLRPSLHEGGPAFDGEPDRAIDLLGGLGLAGSFGFATGFSGELTALPTLDSDADAELLVADGAGVARTETRDAFVVRGGTFTPALRLVSPNPSVGLGADNNSTLSTEHSGMGDFDGDGALEVVLAQRSDSNDAPEASRLVIYSLAGFPVASGAGPSASGLAIRVGPNPARTSATVRFTLAAAGDVVVEAFDGLGRAVAREVLALGAGPQGVPLAVAQWAPGTYVVRVRAGGEMASRPVTVVR